MKLKTLWSIASLFACSQAARDRELSHKLWQKSISEQESECASVPSKEDLEDTYDMCVLNNRCIEFYYIYETEICYFTNFDIKLYVPFEEEFDLDAYNLPDFNNLALYDPDNFPIEICGQRLTKQDRDQYKECDDNDYERDGC